MDRGTKSISYGRFRVVWPGLVFARARSAGGAGVETDEPRGVGELSSLVELALLDRLARILGWRRGAVDAAVLLGICPGVPLLIWAVVASLDFVFPMLTGFFVCLFVFALPVIAVFVPMWQSRSARQLAEVLKNDGCPWCDYPLGSNDEAREIKRCPECGSVRRLLSSGLPEWARERA